MIAQYKERARKGSEIRQRLGVDRETWQRVIDVVEAGPWGPGDRRAVVIRIGNPDDDHAARQTSAVVIRRFAEVLAAVWRHGDRVTAFEVTHDEHDAAVAGDVIRWRRVVN